MHLDLSDGLGLEDILAVLALITSLAAVVGVMWKVRVIWHRVGDRFEQLLDDWQGVEAHPGVAARPGVMERLDAHDQALAALQAQMSPNGGSSLKDSLNRIERDLAALRGHTP